MTPKELYEQNKIGKTVREIAEMTGIKKNTVSSRIFKYRKDNNLPPIDPNRLRRRGPTVLNKKPLKKQKFTPVIILYSYLEVLEKDTCRFIIGDPKKSDCTYCGHEKMPGEQYCKGHYSICVQDHIPAGKAKFENLQWRPKK